ncbi:claudin-9-like [Hippocampus comes]|uniref:claudin-9-like n=1 Tax=Hippocampus comes TaxID=109280 RepID=UPI00094F2DE3|nr:PREDICTED: claudin-9-like [Hippocampus comes]
MASGPLELVGFFLGLIGLLGTLVTTVLPYWEVSVDIDTKFLGVMDTNMNGLWMKCFNKVNGAIMCEMHKAFLMLPYDVQVSRVLMLGSLGLSLVGLLVAVVGMQCTVWLERSLVLKRRVAGMSGCFLLVAGLASLVPVSMSASNVIRNFNMVAATLKYVPGSCLYLGITSAVVSILGGGMLAASFYEGQECGGRRGAYTYKGDGSGDIPLAVARNTGTLQMGVNSRGQTLVRSGAGSYVGVHGKPGGSAYDVTRYV